MVAQSLARIIEGGLRNFASAEVMKTKVFVPASSGRLRLVAFSSRIRETLVFGIASIEVRNEQSFRIATRSVSTSIFYLFFGRHRCMRACGCVCVVVTFRSYAKGDDEDAVFSLLSLSSLRSFSFLMFDWHQTFVLAIEVKRTYSTVYITLYLD